jgi:hypothetical protein
MIAVDKLGKVAKIHGINCLEAVDLFNQFAIDPVTFQDFMKDTFDSDIRKREKEPIWTADFINSAGIVQGVSGTCKAPNVANKIDCPWKR